MKIPSANESPVFLNVFVPDVRSVSSLEREYSLPCTFLKDASRFLWSQCITVKFGLLFDHKLYATAQDSFARTVDSSYAWMINVSGSKDFHCVLFFHDPEFFFKIEESKRSSIDLIY